MADVLRLRRQRQRRHGAFVPSMLKRITGGKVSWLTLIVALPATITLIILSDTATPGTTSLAESTVNAAPIAGPASVVDGDTLVIGGQRIRLFGIDAPESSQSCKINGRLSRCGWRAAHELESKIADRPLHCEQKSRDQYGRIVAICSVEGEELNAWMVRNGQALAYRLFTEDYVLLEAEAAAAQAGMWQGRFVSPWNWREGARL